MAQRKRTEEKVEEAVANAAATAAETTDDLREMAKQQLEVARMKWRQTEKRVTDYIDKNPRRAAMIAAGVGVALGMVLGAAMRGRRR